MARIFVYTLPPIIMVQWKKWGCFPHRIASFHFLGSFPLNHDYGRKGTSFDIFWFSSRYWPAETATASWSAWRLRVRWVVAHIFHENVRMTYLLGCGCIGNIYLKICGLVLWCLQVESYLWIVWIGMVIVPEKWLLFSSIYIYISIYNHRQVPNHLLYLNLQILCIWIPVWCGTTAPMPRFISYIPNKFTDHVSICVMPVASPLI